MNTRYKNFLIWGVVLVVLIMVFRSQTPTASKATTYQYSQFLSAVNKKRISEVTISGRVIKGKSKDNLYFRAAVGKSIEIIDNDTFLIDDIATMNLQSAEKPIIRDSENKKELLVPIKFKNNSAAIKQMISWQE